jgi:RNA polymerase sigma-70 factor (ECF subfamily)
VRTLRNLATDVWRRRNRCSNAVGEIEEQKEKAAGETELRLDLAQALARLDEADRELVTLRYLEELNSREIGEALGLPEGTVRRRLARCRKLLAQHLSQWGGGGEGR